MQSKRILSSFIRFKSRQRESEKERKKEKTIRIHRSRYAGFRFRSVPVDQLVRKYETVT